MPFWKDYDYDYEVSIWFSQFVFNKHLFFTNIKKKKKKEIRLKGTYRFTLAGL